MNKKTPHPVNTGRMPCATGPLPLAGGGSVAVAAVHQGNQRSAPRRHICGWAVAVAAAAAVVVLLQPGT